jgi:CPA2 family monovalent cation:H+ antiporter-2
VLQDLDLIMTVAGGLGAAAVLGLITQRLRLSPIVGYLMAGIVVGPFTPGFVAHARLAEQLAGLGIVLLMFGVGLHFRWEDLHAVHRLALPGALGQIALATTLGVLLGSSMGWRLASGVVYGICISVASTVVLLRMLADHDALHTRRGRAALGWLLVEDLFIVLVLVLLPAVAQKGALVPGSAFVGAVLVALLKIVALVLLVVVVGARVIPALLRYVARTRSRELFTLAVLVAASGIAVAAAELFGASLALGAFLAGMAVGRSEFSSRAASEALPMRDAFAVLFFVSVGMLLDPSRLLENLTLTLLTIAVVVVGKSLGAYAVVRLLRHPPMTALTIAVGLAQIGEFSFIVAALGRELGLLGDAATQALVAASIVSITINPLLFKLVEPLGRRLEAHAVQSELPLPSSASADRAIVVGYGPVGRIVVGLLRDHHLEPLVIELNHATVMELGRQGTPAIYGDAAQPGILELAGVRQANSLIFTASGSLPDAAIAYAKETNPSLKILARAAYLQEVAPAKRSGADIVVSAEAEVALAMAEHLLVQLGATGDQVDRARDQVRSLLGRTEVGEPAQRDAPLH